MRNRTFVGLIFLIIALIVASTPALLTPAGKGIEALAVEVGVLDPGTTNAERSASLKDKDKIPVESYVELKGRQVVYTNEEQSQYDLLDTQSDAERAGNLGGRLSAGSMRRSLPGQLARAGLNDAPEATSEGVLLDKDKCPTFKSGTDVEALLLNDATLARYQTKINDADDSQQCAKRFAARRKAAKSQPSALTAADKRGYQALDRADLTSTVIILKEMGLVGEMFDQDALDAAVKAAAG